MRIRNLFRSSLRRTSTPRRLSVEQLEPREMPASVFAYTDADGDKVKITSSAGVLSSSNVVLSTCNIGKYCGALFLGAEFAGANITFTVTRASTGDGLANVGSIYATGVDLGNVTVNGDLLYINCGDADAARPGLKSLSVRSMGRLGNVNNDGALVSEIDGALGSLRVSGDVKGVNIRVTGDSTCTIGSVTIGGSLIGGLHDGTGMITCTGDMGPVRIGGDLVGGAGIGSGQIGSGAKMGSVTIGGSLIGGAATFSGYVYGVTGVGPVTIGHDLVGGSAREAGTIAHIGTSGKIASVTIGGSIIGGGGDFAGAVRAGHPDDENLRVDLGNVTVGGSVVGGAGKRSGYVYAGGVLGAVRIAHDIVGGVGDFSGRVEQNFDARKATAGVVVGGSISGGGGDYSGGVEVADVTGRITVGGSVVGGMGRASGRIATGNVAGISIGHDVVGGSFSDFSGSIQVLRTPSVFIGGSILGGADPSGTDKLLESASVTADAIGAMTVRGNIVGNVTHRPDIRLFGKHADEVGVALGSLTVGGRVEWAMIECSDNSSNCNARIGTVTVGGDWIASDLVSGVRPGPGGFGTGDSFYVGNISRIDAISIGGTIIGAGSTEIFEFAAHEIGSFRVRGRAVARTAGIDPVVTFSPDTNANAQLVEL
jgi:hypothetical protein